MALSGVGVLDEAVEDEARGSGLLVEYAGEVGGQRGGGVLVVAEHEHPHPLAEVEVLGVDDLHHGVSLGLAAGEHPVDR